MCCSYYALRRVLNCVKRGHPVQSLSWCKGRKIKELNITRRQINWITSRETLRRQVGKSLQTRTLIINRMYDLDLKVYDLRRLYKIYKITNQKLRSQIKPSRQFPIEDQIHYLEKLKTDFLGHLEMDREVVQYDECNFNVNQYLKAAWAPSGRPLKTAQKYYRSKLVVVCGFISVESGKIMMKAFQRKSFTAKHILRFLKELSNKLKDKEVVAFGDNASIHKACREDVQGHCEMLFNMPYRPDLNNIESIWALAKKKYRAEVARLLVTKHTINNLKLVKKILSEITDE